MVKPSMIINYILLEVFKQSDLLCYNPIHKLRLYQQSGVMDGTPENNKKNQISKEQEKKTAIKPKEIKFSFNFSTTPI